MTFQEKYFFILAFIILVMASFFSLGYHHFDEHFQILEFAGLKLNLTTTQNLPWEYHLKMRSSLQPIMVIWLYRLLDFVGINNPFLLTFLLRLLSAFLTFVSVFLLYRLYINKIDNSVLKKWFLIFSFSLWFIIYNGVRFSSENFSGIFFAISFSLYFLLKTKGIKKYIILGILLGFSFLFRYQVGFLTIGFFLWLFFQKKEKLLNLFFIALGILLVVLLGVLLDYWFYEKLTFTTWNYLNQNVLQDKMSSFGTKPWWSYFSMFFIHGSPPLSILFILGVLILMTLKRNSVITWSIIPFLLLHFVIGHKELRFLFPMILFLPIILIQAFEVIENQYVSNFTSKRYFRVLMKISLTINIIFVIITVFRPADSHIGLYKSIYSQYKTDTTLYFIKDNPYKRILDINFYKRKNLNIQEVKTVNDIKVKDGQTALLVFTNKNKPSSFKENNKLIYSTLPKWILKFNFNNWIERTKAWYVYEL